MPRDDLLAMQGVIQDAMGGGKYKVKVTEEGSSTEVIAQLSGRLQNNHIRVLPGDIVEVSVSPYDLTHGLITYRGRRTKRSA